MKKMIAILLLCLFLVACEEEGQEVVSSGDMDTAEDLQGSIKDIMSMGRNVKCTVTVQDSTQTIYFASGKFRSEASIKMEGKNMKAYSINDGKYMYSWMDDAPKGTKISWDYLEKNKKTAEQDEGRNVQLDEEFDFSCVRWSPDSSKFVPPKNIEFVDMTKMMENMQAQMEEFEAKDFKENEDMEEFGEQMKDANKDTLCDMCDTVPDAEQRSECRKNLGC